MGTAGYTSFINRDLPLIEKGCMSKVAYVSRAEAQRVSRHGRRSDGSTRAYRCSHCCLWHLGHRRRRR